MRSIPVVLALSSLIGCDGRTAAAEAGHAAPAPAPAPAAPAAPAAPMRIVATERVGSEVAPPFTLTASDGSGLELTRIDARAVVEGPLGYTELHLDFHNPEDRTREGTFAITLPAGAAVSRFAMETNGQWMEAEVVARPLARRAYDDFLHRKQDPALLEKAAGNQFTARVFPIPARADKRIILSFSQELSGEPYALPLRGLPTIGKVDVALDLGQPDGTHRRETLARSAWQPDRDFTAPPASAAAAVTADRMLVATIPYAGAADAATPADVPRKLILAVDTSASRALGYAGYVRSVRGLVAALRERHGDPLELQVIAFDQEARTIFDGPAAAYGDAQDAAFLARGAAGASSVQALADALARAPRTTGRRLTIVTDGVMTAGPDTAAAVAAVAALPVERVDVVLAGGLRDDTLAKALVRGRPRAGDVFDLDEGAPAIAAGLGEPVAIDVAIEVPGATWVYPATLPSVRPGRPVTVHARLAAPLRRVELIVGGRKQTLDLAPSTPALISRAVAAAELEELEQRLASTTDDAAARALRTDIAERSVRARVLSSQTSMLVLETEADYARYSIDRSRRADVLVIGPDGIGATRPAAIAAPKVARKPKPKVTVSYPMNFRPAGDDARPAPDEDDSGGTGTAISLDEGKMGRRDDEVALARNAGVLGSASLSSGFDDRDVHGGLASPSAGAASGSGGFAGQGGGGTGWGTIGTGSYGTIGHGSGGASGHGVGAGRGGMRGRAASVPSVRIAAPTVQGDLDRSIIRRYVRRITPRVRYCYERELMTTPDLAGTVTTSFSILPDGKVTAVSSSGMSPEVASCVTAVVQTVEFPPVRGGGVVQVSYPFSFQQVGSATAFSSAPAVDIDERAREQREPYEDDVDRGPPALTGQLADVMAMIRDGSHDRALAAARAWHDGAPGDVLALIALGEAQEAKRHLADAARSYGSLIDLFPGRADLRRFAGERLERLGAAAGARALAVDTYRKAVADRPEHLTGHRLLAYALLREGDHASAFAAILAGVDQPIGTGRFAGADRILDEDAGMIAAAYVAAGGPRDTIVAELGKRDLKLASAASTRFVLYWETDANDVDFHIRDRKGGHAFFSNRELPSGGALYDDVTTGYGPECFTIAGTPSAGPYKLAADYYSRGPMGYGMGLLQIQRFDGAKLTFEDRPFVIMNDHAMVDLGTYQP